jgi:hypothetical protein
MRYEKLAIAAAIFRLYFGFNALLGCCASRNRVRVIVIAIAIIIIPAIVKFSMGVVSKIMWGARVLLSLILMADD